MSVYCKHAKPGHTAQLDSLVFKVAQVIFKK